jgi:hypothetical protein
MTTEDAVAQGTDTFWFYDDTTPMTYMMYRTQPSGTTTSAKNLDVSYYSATFPAGASLAIGTASVYLWADNTTGASKTLNLALVAGSTQIGSGSITIGGTTAPTLFSSSFSYSAYTFSNGERLRLNVGSWSNITTYWDGAYNTSRLVVQNLTVVTLASFTATGHHGYVLVEWETASEIDNAGFNVWRNEVEAGPYIKLNDTPIAAQGGPTRGASYSFTDATAVRGVTYYYKLEDVDAHGRSRFHGPVAVTAGGEAGRAYLPLLSR